MLTSVDVESISMVQIADVVRRVVLLLFLLQPTVQAYFGRVKAVCLCSYCCNRYLCCYDGGRLGRVKIVTLRVVPFSPLFSSFNMAFSGVKTFARLKKNACTAGYSCYVFGQQLAVKRLKCSADCSAILFSLPK